MFATLLLCGFFQAMVSPNLGMYYWVVDKRQPDSTFPLVYRTLGGPTRWWFRGKIGWCGRPTGTRAFIERELELKEFRPGRSRAVAVDV
jgi:hypothetical protein